MEIQSENKSYAYDVEDEKTKKEQIVVDGNTIDIIQYELDAGKEEYVAQFVYNDVFYTINATMSEKEFKDTVGQKTVSKITVNVTVERLLNGKWAYYTSWTETNYNSVYVSSSKTLSVPTGYYYRVYCIHYANSDVSDSYTDGIYI